MRTSLGGLGSVEQCFAHPQDGASVRVVGHGPCSRGRSQNAKGPASGTRVGEEAGGRQEGPGDWLHPWEQHITHRL